MTIVFILHNHVRTPVGNKSLASRFTLFCFCSGSLCRPRLPNTMAHCSCISLSVVLISIYRLGEASHCDFGSQRSKVLLLSGGHSTATWVILSFLYHFPFCWLKYVPFSSQCCSHVDIHKDPLCVESLHGQLWHPVGVTVQSSSFKC